MEIIIKDDINRVEVIDGSGRVLVKKLNEGERFEFKIEDCGRTLKLFVKLNYIPKQAYYEAIEERGKLKNRTMSEGCELSKLWDKWQSIIDQFEKQ